MLYNIIFSLNIVMPLVILAAMGYGAKRAGLIGDGFLKGGNKVIFYLAIPATLFNSLYAADLGEILDYRFMAFIALWTVASFAIIWIVTHLALRKRHPGVISAYVNGAHRGNLAMLGLPLLFSILGDTGYAAKVALAAAIIIPLYNIQTIILLTIHSETPKKLNAGGLVLGIIKNPPIIGTALGLAAAFTDITLPNMAEQVINSLATLTVPLALICLGGAMAFKGFDAKFKFALTSALVKVAALPIVTIALAWLLGFRGNDLTILMILHGVPTAVGSYVMIVELGGDTYIAGTNVMLTTILSAFTLSVLIFVFRTAGIIL
jgi:predicted permease